MAVNIFSVILIKWSYSYHRTFPVVFSKNNYCILAEQFSQAFNQLTIFVYFHKNDIECIIWLKTSTKRHCLTKVWFLPRDNDLLCKENQENGTFLVKNNHGREKLVPVRVLRTRFYIWKLSPSREINEKIPWIERKTPLKRERLPHVYHVIGHHVEVGPISQELLLIFSVHSGLRSRQPNYLQSCNAFYFSVVVSVGDLKLLFSLYLHIWVSFLLANKYVLL